MKPIVDNQRGFALVSVFMLILLVGFVYVWKKGALQWD